MANKSDLKPGQQADRSGQYGLRGPRGGDKGREATIVRGKPAPPTPQKGDSWHLNDPTKHQS